MSDFDVEFLSHFGNIKFAEEDNLCTTDFENSLTKFLSKEKKKHGKYKFGEINNKSINDYGKSFMNYFY